MHLYNQPDQILVAPPTTEKLGVEAATVQHGVEGLMYLLTECSKMQVRELTVSLKNNLYGHFTLVQTVNPQSWWFMKTGLCIVNKATITYTL